MNIVIRKLGERPSFLISFYMEVMRMNIGIIGAGSIGKFLLEKINREKAISGYEITAVFDDRNKSKELLNKLSNKYNFTVHNELQTFLDSSVDLIVECANIEVVKQYARQIILKKDLLLISVGALVDSHFYNKLKETAELNNNKLYLPAGAIGGLEVLRSANALSGLETVKLVTRKPAQALSVGPINKEITIFDGSAKDAIVNYPKNANIAIIISLSGIGIERTRVKIIADPKVTKNVHSLEANGDFGKLELILENNPSPNNPKTSYLTALSILSSLQSLDKTISFG